MDVGRFEDFLRSLSERLTRRGIARVVAGLALAVPLRALLDPADSDAKKKKKCKGKKKKCGKKCIPKSKCCTDADCSGDEICQGGACILPFCGGKNHCDELAQCNSSGVQCFCFVNAESGESFCGTLSDEVVDDCSQCVGDDVCVNTQGPLCGGGLRCSPPCPTPL